MTHRRSLISTGLSIALALAATPYAGIASADGVPRFFDPNERLARPNLAGLPRLRFLTSLDFPPFNFADAQGRVTGFNVDLARALCVELNIADKCEIQAMPWDELDATLEGKRGEAIIAGHRVTAELRATREVSAPYFRFPARFAARRDAGVADADDMTPLTAGKKVAVVARSAQAAMLAAWFPKATAVPVDTIEDAHAALLSGDVDFVFADGVGLAFWLGSTASQDCCDFVSGPFLSGHFLGRGMVIVMRQDSASLAEAIDSALKSLEEDGTYREIFTRYFPLNPFSEGSVGSAPTEGKTEGPDETG